MFLMIFKAFKNCANVRVIHVCIEHAYIHIMNHEIQLWPNATRLLPQSPECGQVNDAPTANAPSTSTSMLGSMFNSNDKQNSNKLAWQY